MDSYILFTVGADEVEFFKRLCQFSTQLFLPYMDEFIDQLEYWGLATSIRTNTSMGYFVSSGDIECRAAITTLGLRCEIVVSPYGYGGIIMIPLDDE